MEKRQKIKVPNYYYVKKGGHVTLTGMLCKSHVKPGETIELHAILDTADTKRKIKEFRADLVCKV